MSPPCTRRKPPPPPFGVSTWSRAVNRGIVNAPETLHVIDTSSWAHVLNVHRSTRGARSRSVNLSWRSLLRELRVKRSRTFSRTSDEIVRRMLRRRRNRGNHLLRIAEIRNTVPSRGCSNALYGTQLNFRGSLRSERKRIPEHERARAARSMSPRLSGWSLHPVELVHVTRKEM